MKTIITVLLLISIHSEGQLYGGMSIGKSFGKQETGAVQYVANFDDGHREIYRETYIVRKNNALLNINAGYAYKKAMMEFDGRADLAFTSSLREEFAGLRAGFLFEFGADYTDDHKAQSITPLAGIYYSHVSNDLKFLNGISQGFGIRYKNKKWVAELSYIKKTIQISVGGLAWLKKQ